MTHPPRYIVKSLLFVVLVLAALAATAGPVAAKTAPPCWKTLINDWYDGRIDGTYPIHCYRDALKHLPTDVETYSSARDDIKQALQQRITQSRNGGGPPTTTGGGDNNSSGGPTPPGGSKGNPPGNNNPPGKNNPKTGGNDHTAKGPVKALFPKSGSADSVPVPLIVLGSLAFVLMLAGAAGYLARRTRTRRLQLASAAATQPGGAEPPPQAS